VFAGLHWIVLIFLQQGARHVRRIDVPQPPAPPAAVAAPGVPWRPPHGLQLPGEGLQHEPGVQPPGGTSVSTNSSGVWTAEKAWSDDGGGNSKYEKKPTWQSGISTITGTGRGVPDISWDADPNSGVSVYDSTSYEGYVGWMVFGGTSVSSPSLAGAANSSLPASIFANTNAFLTNLYSNFKNESSLFRDITTGSAGRNKAGVGRDYCTGVGVPTGPASS
jgi:hypothetical protein